MDPFECNAPLIWYGCGQAISRGSLVPSTCHTVRCRSVHVPSASSCQQFWLHHATSTWGKRSKVATISSKKSRSHQLSSSSKLRYASEASLRSRLKVAVGPTFRSCGTQTNRGSLINWSCYPGEG